MCTHVCVCVHALTHCLFAASTPVLWDGPQNHTFRHTLFCQDGIPNIGLSETYDEDELFSFDFSQNTRVPRLPDFAEWAQEQGDASAIKFDKDFCETLMREVSPQLEGQIPVSRGQGQRVAFGGLPSYSPKLLHSISYLSHLCLGLFFSTSTLVPSATICILCFLVGRRQPRALKSIELDDPTECLHSHYHTRQDRGMSLHFNKKSVPDANLATDRKSGQRGPPTRCPSCIFLMRRPFLEPQMSSSLCWLRVCPPLHVSQLSKQRHGLNLSLLLLPPIPAPRFACS